MCAALLKLHESITPIRARTRTVPLEDGGGFGRFSGFFAR